MALSERLPDRKTAFVTSAGPDSLNGANSELSIYTLLQKAEDKWGSLAEYLVPSDPMLRTKEHRRNTAFLALGIYFECTRITGVPQDRIDSIILQAWLHDMGKNPEIRQILKRSDKPGPEEFKKARDHVIIGATKLWELKDRFVQWGVDKELEELIDHVALSIYYHHERADGKGDLEVPGDLIPPGAQMISIAETFDASLHGKKIKFCKKWARYRKGEKPKNYEEAWGEIMRKQERWDQLYISALFNVLQKMTEEERELFKKDKLFS